MCGNIGIGGVVCSDGILGHCRSVWRSKLTMPGTNPQEKSIESDSATVGAESLLD
jgi:hypothetical protein